MKHRSVIGKVFGKLTVIGVAKATDNRGEMVLCRCACGKEKTTFSKYLLRGQTKSCGCLVKRRVGNVGFARVQ